MPARKRRKPALAKAVNRKGKPFTLYLSDDLSEDLEFVSSQRKVHKSELVRMAVRRYLKDLSAGQLELPLGL